MMNDAYRLRLELEVMEAERKLLDLRIRDALKKLSDTEPSTVREPHFNSESRKVIPESPD